MGSFLTNKVDLKNTEISIKIWTNFYKSHFNSADTVFPGVTSLSSEEQAEYPS